MTSRSDSLADRASASADTGARGDALGRALMGVLGSCLIVVPLVTTSGLGLVAASPAIVLGVVLVVLCAFQPRINGRLRYRGFDIPIGPPHPRSRLDGGVTEDAGSARGARQL